MKKAFVLIILIVLSFNIDSFCNKNVKHIKYRDYSLLINPEKTFNDSLYVIDTICQCCGEVKGVVYDVDLQSDTSCAGILTIKFMESQSYNYVYKKDNVFKSGDKFGNFKFLVMDNLDSAKAVIKFISFLGKEIVKYYQYYPQIIKSNVTELKFDLNIYDTITKTFEIINTGVLSAKILDLKFKNNRPEFQFISEGTPFILAPGEKREISVTASLTLNTVLPLKDTITAVLECYETSITGLSIQSGPNVIISDADFGTQPIGNETAQTVSITNKADADVIIYEPPSWPEADHEVFTRTDLDLNGNWPIVMKKGATYTFQVYCKPNAPKSFKTTAWFRCNALKDKTWSVWTVNGIITEVEDNQDLFKNTIVSISPNPVSDKLFISFNQFTNDAVNLKIMNELGTILIEKNELIVEQNNEIVININNLPTGIYFCNIIARNYAETKKFVILR